ncbi:Subtilase family protein [Arthrobacter sp. 9AX]|uniref:S8 family peptidase n=1 Tax=Arthrobacter sp. 9AX TaxID=2653131 RepID=UPI0012F2280D|nr:S8 family serine peptidase [Arthrobacter sp. 9AX]VXC12481.1 Subtilase family protein [Arthrobacter sp. 9AX]
MKKKFPLAACLAAAMVLSAGPAVTVVTSAAAASTAAGGKFVVSFSGTPEAATAAIEAAGGTVEDVISQIGVALVTAADGEFMDEVRSGSGIRGAARNHSVGVSRQGMPHHYAGERLDATDRAQARSAGVAGNPSTSSPGPHAEPLSGLQWDMEMIGATPDGAWDEATGKGVDVGIMDTGIDASHPDIAPNFDAERSRNFTTDIPDIDGPCEYTDCKDPADVDNDGHGTHVAGIVAAADNDFGIGGVAPEATLVNVRAGQDSGYFFLYETVKALVYAGDIDLDVVNMSFYTDPWLYNCTSRDEYVSGTVSDAQLTEQRLISELVLGAVKYASDRGVTLVAAAGNEHTDLAAPTRSDATSPDYPPNTAQPRVVKNTCLDLPSEAPEVISVSSVGPSGTKADYSNYGFGEVEVAAPGGWFKDYFGTPQFQTPGNLILSSYPLQAAIEQGLADAAGNPVDGFSIKHCDDGKCGFYTYLQGTSMASPHAVGVAALIIQERGKSTGDGGYALDPEAVARVMLGTADDRACPVGGVEDYTDEGRTTDWNATCEGTAENNGLYGEGIVDAEEAVS